MSVEEATLLPMAVKRKKQKRDYKALGNIAGTVPIVAEILKRYRENRGLTQAEVTEGAGLPKVRLSQYECGANNPPPEHLLKLAHFYNVSPRVFISAEGIVQLQQTVAVLCSLLDQAAPDMVPTIQPPSSDVDVPLDI